MSQNWWPYKIGIPAAGHIASGGFWHPGAGETCVRCNPPEPKRKDRDGNK